jgi:hypothetical protein
MIEMTVKQTRKPSHTEPIYFVELATARRAGWRPGRKANSTLRTVAPVRRTVGKNGGRFS